MDGTDTTAVESDGRTIFRSFGRGSAAANLPASSRGCWARPQSALTSLSRRSACWARACSKIPVGPRRRSARSTRSSSFIDQLRERGRALLELLDRRALQQARGPPVEPVLVGDGTPRPSDRRSRGRLHLAVAGLARIDEHDRRSFATRVQKPPRLRAATWSATLRSTSLDVDRLSIEINSNVRRSTSALAA